MAVARRSYASIRIMSKRGRAQGSWVITGAGSGFGRELAIQLAERGESLSLWDRNLEGLEQTRALIGERARCHLIEVDVSSAEAVNEAASRTRGELGPIAHAIHSAGILRVGDASRMEASDYRAMMDVNYLGSVHVALALVDDLRRTSQFGGRSHLVLVSSIAGLRAAPELAGYSASKFAVLGFAQALRDELSATNIDIRVLCPPPGDTPMVRNLPFMPKIYELAPPMSAEVVAREALRALERDDFIVLVDARSRLYSAANRLWPGALDFIIRRVTGGRSRN